MSHRFPRAPFSGYARASRVSMEGGLGLATSVVTGWWLGAVILPRAEDFVLAFCDMVVVYKYGDYETCSSLHLSDPCPCSAGFRRPSTALSGETNAALPRPSDHYRERLALNTTEQRAKITGVACGAALAVNDVSLANV